jgi:hypothetical protein
MKPKAPALEAKCQSRKRIEPQMDTDERGSYPLKISICLSLTGILFFLSAPILSICGWKIPNKCPTPRKPCKTQPMKLLLLCLACLSLVSCAPPSAPPPGMPLDPEHRQLPEDSAITKITR